MITRGGLVHHSGDLLHQAYSLPVGSIPHAGTPTLYPSHMYYCIYKVSSLEGGCMRVYTGLLYCMNLAFIV